MAIEMLNSMGKFRYFSFELNLHFSEINYIIVCTIEGDL
jgi:hypothetical protein